MCWMICFILRLLVDFGITGNIKKDKKTLLISLYTAKSLVALFIQQISESRSHFLKLSVHRFVLKALGDWNHNTAKWVSFAVETVMFDWICACLLETYEKEAYVLE